ncbi:unnamed protein product [Chilo suppressalis]|uniref:Gamma-glutamyltransferase n=1 Tax=Chilo suppressalis TaxID=168631 RepID=A0ABN8BF13_CHISP|nr:unnamed protein product [Chilo suppressalis]
MPWSIDVTDKSIVLSCLLYTCYLNQESNGCNCIGASLFGELRFQTIMERSNMAPRGMVVTPHHLATQSALNVLKEGGTAIDAAVAAAATLAVVYPHMNSIGGDGFWLIIPPNAEPFVIEACGAAGRLAKKDFYKDYAEIPQRGPKSAATVAGTVGGWHEALHYVTESGYRNFSRSKLLADAIYYAEHGFPISTSLAIFLKDFYETESPSNEFLEIFAPNGEILKVGDKLYQHKLAKTLKTLAEEGFNSFYDGKLAEQIAEDMEILGMPITLEDLNTYAAVRKEPLRLQHSFGEILNVPPPTQGVVSLGILGILDQLRIKGDHEGTFIHAAVEATKQGFLLRDEHITDPLYMEVDANFLLSPENIIRMAKNVDAHQSATITKCKGPGDTVWLGVMDNKGYSVSFIQSVYHDFGSGVILPRSGILWHNRGVAFSLKKDHILSLKPGKKPFHTLNPAAAVLNDGRVMIYGTRGGDGQPQTQAAVFHRYVVQDLNLQKAVSAPRWLYGETLTKGVDTLKLEDRFDKNTVEYLKERGHKVEILEQFSEKMGQAGALVRHTNAVMEGAFDPRGDGSAAGF